jgi:hypothetical protein
VPVAPLADSVELKRSVVKVPAAGVAPPIAGGADKSNVPPSVKLPELVTVPVKVKPLTVPVPATEVTEPDPLLLKVFQSVEVK